MAKPGAIEASATPRKNRAASSPLALNEPADAMRTAPHMVLESSDVSYVRVL